ncbi:HAD family hydrolase [Ferruginibacter paludis]|uniref:HAD family hydrolase n=1 Tax=Ferruginibacter paludis TaxID=1310417 RepID=UPI0025B46AF3|nr:HAD family hydrolase [Ferruginibacter paludis]MDN3657897.1 HAD family hydrolase [Ferruginibacter paludis]
MTKKAIIFDLDNTIYPVAAIGDQLFKSLFRTIEKDGNYQGTMGEIKAEIMRKPFQVVAKMYAFSDALTTTCLKLLTELTYDDTIAPFDDYALTTKLTCLKFLVTTGFKKLQLSKIDQLNIKDHFEEIIIVDPIASSLTKKNFFKDIMLRYNLTPNEVLVIGDDLHSEIKAAKELGIATVLYDYLGENESLPGENVITNYQQLGKYV